MPGRYGDTARYSDDETVYIGAEVPRAVHERVSIEAIRQRRRIKDIIAEALTDWHAKQGEEAKPEKQSRKK